LEVQPTIEILTGNQKRAQDAHDAKAYLAKLPYVNSNKIGLIGWAHVGTVYDGRWSSSVAFGSEQFVERIKVRGARKHWGDKSVRSRRLLAQGAAGFLEYRFWPQKCGKGLENTYH